MAVWYLDNDEEITDAVARLRSATDAEVVFVVSPGSRIATGRINFKLLAREARSRDIAMAIASPDEQVRSLAMAAGVLALPTAEEAEAALARGDIAPEPTSPGVDAIASSANAATAEESAGEQRTRRRRLSILVAVVLALVVVGGVASLQTFTTAEITLVPRVSTVGPVSVAVVALTSIDEPNAAAGEVPALAVPFSLSIEGVFEASGTEVSSASATGTVEFSSSDQSFDQEIVAGTRVSTPSGIEFQTTEAVILARPADDSGPARVTAEVRAIEVGPDGNVDPATITMVPSLASQGISVSNADGTGGGQLVEAAIVTRADYDAAAGALQNRLGGELAAQLREPEGVPPGHILFGETARLGTITYSPVAADVVGQVNDTFTLRGTTDASALAVDESLVQAVAAAALVDQTPEGMVILPATIRAQAGEATADGERIVFGSSATGDASVVVDPEAVIAQVAGLPVSEAQSILEELGATTVSVWPDFLGDLPDDGSRITLDVQDPPTAE